MFEIIVGIIVAANAIVTLVQNLQQKKEIKGVKLELETTKAQLANARYVTMLPAPLDTEADTQRSGSFISRLP